MTGYDFQWIIIMNQMKVMLEIIFVILEDEGRDTPWHIFKRNHPYSLATVFHEISFAFWMSSQRKTIHFQET